MHVCRWRTHSCVCNFGGIASQEKVRKHKCKQCGKWGKNIRFFNDIFIYNVLSASKFVNELIKKEGYKFDVVCVHDWLSSISGIMVKNEIKFPWSFMCTALNGEGAEVTVQGWFRILNGKQLKEQLG